MLFVEVTVIIAHDTEHMQSMFNVFTKDTQRRVMQINTQKAEVLYKFAPQRRNSEKSEITIGGSVLTVLKKLKFLGITVIDNNKEDKEVANRIQNACVYFVKLSISLWNRRVYVNFITPYVFGKF